MIPTRYGIIRAHASRNLGRDLQDNQKPWRGYLEVSVLVEQTLSEVRIPGGASIPVSYYKYKY